MFDKNIYKIIFTGPVGAGKSTAIGSISDIPVVSTEQNATDHTKEKKKTTTVALDYGRIDLEEGEKIHVYGTPGQQRFDFMWDVLIANAIGVIILIDNANDDPISDLRIFLNGFAKFINTSAIVVGITRTDLGGGPVLSSYHHVLKEFYFNPPVFEVDVRKRNDVAMLIQALLFSIDQSINHEEALDMTL